MLPQSKETGKLKVFAGVGAFFKKLPRFFHTGKRKGREVNSRPNFIKTFLFAIVPKSVSLSLFSVFGYVGKISVIFVTVKAVADDKAIGNGEQRKVGGILNDTAVGLIEQGDDVQ